MDKRLLATATKKRLLYLSFLMVMATGCTGGSYESDLAYMSPSEREEYEYYGFVPDDIEAREAQRKKGGKVMMAIFFGVPAAVLAGYALFGKKRGSK